MSAPELVSEQLSLVVVGKFNPQIFQPFWFAKNQLIPPAEAESAKVQVVHPGVSDFSLDWCHLNVGTDKLVWETNHPERYLPLFDLLISTFSLLSHTPVTALGINLVIIFQCKTEEEWHAFGDKFAPKDAWKGILEVPRLTALQMKGERTDKHKGMHAVTIQGKDPRQIVISINDHYDLGTGEEGAQGLPELLDAQKKNSIELSQSIAKRLVANG